MRHNDNKLKIYKVRIKIFIKTNGILHTSRCTARKEKTSLRHTFLIVRNLSDFRFYCGFVFADM